MSRKTLPILLIALFVLIAAGCCPEQKCRDKYGLIKPSECPPVSGGTGGTGGGTGPGGGGPGPIITLGLAQSGTLPWRVAGTLQTAESDSIYPTDPNEHCGLRYDFQGKYILKFRQWEENSSTPQDATKVVAGNAQTLVTIEAIGPKLVWKVQQKAAGGKKCLNPLPRMDYPPNQLPPELLNLTDLEDATSGKKLDKIEIQVEE